MSTIKQPWFRFAISGAAAGAINGLFGAGGGMLLIPLLIHFAKLDDKRAFSSSIYIILPLSVVSLIIYGINDSLSIQQSLPYLFGGLIGGFCGGLLFKKTSVNFLHKFLGLLIIWGGVRLLW